MHFSSRIPYSQEAIVKLNTLQSNAATLEAMRASGASPKADYAILEMLEYIKRIGYTVCDLFGSVAANSSHVVTQATIQNSPKI